MDARVQFKRRIEEMFRDFEARNKDVVKREDWNEFKKIYMECALIAFDYASSVAGDEIEFAYYYKEEFDKCMGMKAFVKVLENLSKKDDK